MKIGMSDEGVLQIKAETSAESFALKKWKEEYTFPSDENPLEKDIYSDGIRFYNSMADEAVVDLTEEGS